jgi:hypothetical protein
MRQSRGLLWGALGMAGALVALVASAVESSTANGELPVHDFVDLNEAWLHATRGLPLPVEWISFASTALQKPETTGKSAGGVTLIGGLSSSTTNTTATPVAILPIVSLGGSDMLEAHRRSMGLQLFITAVSRFRPSTDPNDAGVTGAGVQDARMSLIQALPGWTRATHLELFVTETVFFLQGESKHDKCLHYERLQDHARSLGWTPTAPPAGMGTSAAVPAAWSVLESSAKGFYVSYISGQSVLPKVCELSRSVTSDDLEKEIKDIVERRLVERFQELAGQVGSAMETPLANLVALENQSVVDVPTKAMFELNRATQNTASIVTYVQKDELGLESGSLSWRMQAAEAERRAASEVQNQIGGLERLDAARAELAATLHELRNISSKLQQIGSLAGFGTELAACQRLGVVSEPTPSQNDALIRGFDACLGAIGRAYTRLKTEADQDPRGPAFREFASKVAGLSQRIADVYNLEMQRTQ